MVEIYISVDSENKVVGFGYKEYGAITKDPKKSILVEVRKDHPILNGDMDYIYQNGTLIENNTLKLHNEKESKMQELSSACHNEIISGFEHEVNDEVYRFSYSEEAQINLNERWQLFQNNMVETIRVSARDSNRETVRLELDRNAFNALYLDSVKHKEKNISKLQDSLYPLVKRAESQKDLDLIKWDMQIVDPEPELIKVTGDRNLNSEVSRVELEGARAVSEAMNVMYMMSMGVM